MTENPEIGAVTRLKSRVKEGGSMMHDGNERKGKKIFCSYPTFSCVDIPARNNVLILIRDLVVVVVVLVGCMIQW